MNIDELRRELALTRHELVGARKALKASEQRCEELIQKFRELETKAHKAAQLLLPENVKLSDHWDDYKEPGY